MLDSVKRTSVNYQIFNHRECFCSKGLDKNRITVFKSTHVQLTSCDSSVWSVSFTVNEERTHTADSLTTIVVKSNRVITFVYQTFIQNVISYWLFVTSY